MTTPKTVANQGKRFNNFSVVLCGPYTLIQFLLFLVDVMESMN